MRRNSLSNSKSLNSSRKTLLLGVSYLRVSFIAVLSTAAVMQFLGDAASVSDKSAVLGDRLDK